MAEETTTTTKITEEQVMEALSSVMDPEIPAVSVVDLGMITRVEIAAGNHVTVGMTPTFAACPAIRYLQDAIRDKVAALPCVAGAEVTVDRSVVWNSNRITERGKKLLKDFGLAPPPVFSGNLSNELLADVPCPHCDSRNTRLDAPFGSTLCRSIHYCNDCKQWFEQFKPV